MNYLERQGYHPYWYVYYTVSLYSRPIDLPPLFWKEVLDMAIVMNKTNVIADIKNKESITE